MLNMYTSPNVCVCIMQLSKKLRCVYSICLVSRFFVGINNWYQPTVTQTVLFNFLQVAALNLYKNITAMSSPGKYE